MNSRERQRRVYIRNAMLSFICVAVCLVIDIRSFVLRGGIYFTWQLGISYVLYVLLVFLGIRAVKKAREYKKEE